MTKSYRLGSASRSILSHVASHPGCTMWDTVQAQTAAGGHRFAYAACHRLLDAGLIAQGPTTGHNYYLVPTIAGFAALARSAQRAADQAA